MKKIVWMLYGTIVILSMLDGIHTKMFLDLGVGAEVVSPFLGWLITTTGTVYALFYVKSAALIFLLVLLAIYLKKDHKELYNVPPYTLK